MKLSFHSTALGLLLIAVCALFAAQFFAPDLLQVMPGDVVLAMTTLAANKPRAFELGRGNTLPDIASDIIYEGAAVGLVDATGHARPLNAADRFAGFAERKADNSAGAAAAINVDVIKSGEIQLAVTGAVITDVGQPVYATDDDTFVFLPTGGVFIGFVKRFVSSGVVVVEFNAGVLQDPYGDTVRNTISATYTTDIEDTGKTLFVDTDAFVITLLTYAAATAHRIKVVNIGAFGTVAVSIDPAAGDLIAGPDDTGADGGLLVNTKATARRGDYVVLTSGGDNGYIVEEIRGIWTIA
jgi:hypothetical protein